MRKLIITACITLISASAFAAATAGKVSTVTGSVDVVKGNAVMGRIAKTGAELTLEDILRTKRKGYAEVEFMDGTNIKVFEKSRLVFSGLERTKDGSNIEIQKGKVLFRVEKMHDVAGDFRIKTSNAVIGVKGTAVGVETGPQGTTVEVYTGSVLVELGSGQGGIGGIGGLTGTGGAVIVGAGGGAGGSGVGGGVLVGAGGGVLIGAGGGLTQYSFGAGGGQSSLFGNIGGLIGGGGAGGAGGGQGGSLEQQLFNQLGGGESGGGAGEGLGGAGDGFGGLLGGGLGDLGGVLGDLGGGGGLEDLNLGELGNAGEEISDIVQDIIQDTTPELGTVHITITIN